MPYYAVAKGKNTGIFSTWSETTTYIKGFKGAVYKKFDTETEAQEFIDDNMETTDLTEDFDYYVYTDGSCSNNGKPSAQAGMGIYFGENDSRNISKRVFGKQSNNTGELGALIEAHKVIGTDAKNGKRIAVISDSKYGIRCVTSYGKKCAQKNWSEDIPNKEMVKQAYEMYSQTPNIKVIHIMAHTGATDIHSLGNDGADRLANAAIGLASCPYAVKPARNTSNTINAINTINTVKTYLNVPFAQKDFAKELGARWDPKMKKWYTL